MAVETLCTHRPPQTLSIFLYYLTFSGIVYIGAGCVEPLKCKPHQSNSQQASNCHEPSSKLHTKHPHDGITVHCDNTS